MSDQAITGVTPRDIWRRLAPIIVVGTFYFGVLVYPVLRIRNLLLPQAPGTPELLLIMVGPIVCWLICERFPAPWSRRLSALALTWLGVCFLAFPLVVVWEFVRLFIALDAQTWGMSLLCLVSVTAIYGLWSAQSLAVKHVNIAAPEALKHTTLAQISDVHVGSRSGRFLQRIVNRVNALEPDYVLITGDLIDHRNISTAELSSLAELRAPTYFIIGNHERYVDLAAICERLRGLNVQVLRNESRTLGDIQLIGIDDAEAKTQLASVLAQLEPVADKFRILLYHRPEGAADAADWGVDLMLCGHTHNGQIMPFNLLVRRFFPNICGLYSIAGLKLYVSPGSGTWGPVLRLGSRCEISMIHLA